MVAANVESLADLCSLAGGAVMTLPFLLRQRTRDAAESIDPEEFEPGSDEHAAATRAYRTLSREVARHARKDFRLVAIGAALVAFGSLLDLLFA